MIASLQLPGDRCIGVSRSSLTSVDPSPESTSVDPPAGRSLFVLCVAMAVQVFVHESGSGREPMPDFVVKAYVLSLFFLVVVLVLAVGDAWTQSAEVLVHSVSAVASRYTHYNLDFAFSHL